MNAASKFARVAEFLLDQSRKTVRRPERVFIIVFERLLYRPWRALVRFITVRRVLASVGWALPAKLRRGSLRVYYEALYYEQGNALLDADRPVEAANAFRRCLAVSKNPHYFFVAAICMLHGLGSFGKAMAL